MERPPPQAPGFRGTIDGLADALEHAGDAIVITDADSLIIQVNKAARRLFDRRLRRDVRFVDLHEALAPRLPDGSTIPVDRAPINRALKGEVVAQHECSVLGEGGQRIIVTVSAVPIRSATEGHPVLGALLIMRDVTRERMEERRKAQLLAEVERQRRLLEATFADVPVGIAVLVPPDWRHEAANAVYRSAPGAAPHLLGTTLGETFPAPAGGRLERALQRSLRRGNPVRVSDLRLSGPDGAEAFWTFTVRPSFGPDGSVDRVLVVASETTQRARARKRLSEAVFSIEASRQYLQTIVDSLPEGVILVDNRYPPHVVIANRAACEIAGAPIQAGPLTQFVRQGFAFFTPKGERMRLHDIPVVRALQGDDAPTTEVVIVRPDGVRIPVLTNQAPVRGEDGKVTGAILVFQDVTRLKEIERLKDDFISMVSHELRTPTTTIQAGALTLLRRERQLRQAERRQLMQDIADEATRLHLLVEDLLGMASVEAGMQPSLEPLVPHRFVNNLVLEMRDRLVQHLLTLDVPPELPAVDADPVALAQVFRNLLDNAVKYSAPGSRIEITGRVEGTSVCFGVMDDGIGFDLTEAENVFAPFFRTDRARHEALSGVGLGLTICRRLVEAMGGRIWAEPRAEGGAVFYFTLRQSDIGGSAEPL